MPRGPFIVIVEAQGQLSGTWKQIRICFLQHRLYFGSRYAFLARLELTAARYEFPLLSSLTIIHLAAGQRMRSTLAEADDYY